jgi:hydroxypyruvate isomerase
MAAESKDREEAMQGPLAVVPDLLTRRRMMMRSLAGAGAGALAASGVSCASKGLSQAKGAVRKRLKQSVVKWCFDKHWDVETMVKVAVQLGCGSIELMPVQHWPLLKKNGLVCAVATSHGFEKGLNNPKYHEMCLALIRKGIDDCADFGFPNVITFTGFREDIPDDVGLRNCVEALKKVVGYAEQKRVTIVLEILNSRVAEDWKGHPGYQGDHADYCMEIAKRVGSPRFKILFDIYHVQIMDGDVIARIRQYKDLIGHYHTAGVPGRGELDDKQELNYKPIMEEIARTGFSGWVGQEFIPTRDPLQGLSEAVVLCDV